MKILQVITSLRTGGAERLLIDLVPMLKAKGHEVDVALFDGVQTPLKRQLEETGCKIYSLGKSVYSLSNLWKLARIMRKYDIVHTHNTAPQLYSAIGSVLFRTFLVTTEHSTSNRRRNRKWYVPIDRWMYSRYKKVICISEKAEENLKKHLGHIKAEICVVHNGVNVEMFATAQADEELSGNKQRFAIVMVAGFRYEKDQDTLIKAVSLLPEDKFELWLVGEGERRDVLKELSKTLGVEKRVKFLGLRTDVPRVLHAADAVAMSSHFEGLSLSNIEGMAVGKPFVASDVDGLHDVTIGAGILVAHGNEQAFADEFLRLAEDREYYCQVADACFQRAKQFDIKTMVDAYEEIYMQLKG